MRVFLKITVVIFFSLLSNTLSKRCDGSTIRKIYRFQGASQNHSSINVNKQMDASNGIFQSFEEADNDDENPLKSFVLKSLKNIENPFYHKYSFVNISLFQIRIAYRYSRCIHFRSLLI